jgi:plasmid replication initiation protein
MKKNKEKKERGRITYNGRLYPNLHKLAELVYNKMTEHNEIFDNLPTASNKGKVVHRIGKQIAALRCQVARSDVHTRAPGEVNLDLFKSDTYKNKNELYVLAQCDIIQFCCSAYRKKRWGSEND